MVSIGQSVEKILKEKKISTELINMHTIKPLDKDQIRQSSKKTKLFVTIEEHSVIGGLGSSVAEFISNLKDTPRLIKFGLEDNYNISGDYSFILEQSGLTAENISSKILKELNI
jgi:transketolase